VCDPEGRVLHHQRGMCNNWNCDILGIHQAGGIEVADAALAGLEASRWRELELSI